MQVSAIRNAARNLRSLSRIVCTRSAFLWLVVFLLISAVWRGKQHHPYAILLDILKQYCLIRLSVVFAGFLPLTSAGELVLVVLLSVSLQEAARYALWKLHRC